ncbi:MAG: hypothetical protein ACP5OZ_02830 [Candidatus Woesearchaeota archaeon]
MKKNLVLLFFLALFLTTATAHAEVINPDNISETALGKHGTSPARSLNAVAGNVTQLTITTQTVTQSWQGYVGNISGTIVLDDSNNKTLYDWSLADPQGEIYAVRTSTTPDWTSVVCANSTHINTEQIALNMGDGADRINNTFTEDFSGSFLVGGVVINSTSGCKQVATYVNDAADPSKNFKEVLLYDPTNALIIYTALIKKGYSVGYNGNTYNFQMIVGEDGHGNTVASTYYFYVEIE